MSCFIEVFSVRLTQRDNIYQLISCGWTFSTCGCALARCSHARTLTRPHDWYVCTLATPQATQARETLLYMLFPRIVFCKVKCAITIFHYSIKIVSLWNQNRFVFCHVLTEVLQIYTMHKLPHRKFG